MIGETIAHYRITAKLGEGGMGEVYRARDTKLDRDVAIKILPAAFAQDADRMARFRREAQVLTARGIRTAAVSKTFSAVFFSGGARHVFQILSGP
jgi:serine/threonine protein kinase